MQEAYHRSPAPGYGASICIAYHFFRQMVRKNSVLAEAHTHCACAATTMP